MNTMELPAYMPQLLIAYVLYVGICAGLIAQKHGKNPVLYGLAAVISPLNLIILGIWAFGKFESDNKHDA